MLGGTYAIRLSNFWRPRRLARWPSRPCPWCTHYVPRPAPSPNPWTSLWGWLQSRCRSTRGWSCVSLTCQGGNRRYRSCGHCRRVGSSWLRGFHSVAQIRAWRSWIRSLYRKLDHLDDRWILTLLFASCKVFKEVDSALFIRRKVNAHINSEKIVNLPLTWVKIAQ